MTDTMANRPQVGDLVCDINYTQWEREYGIISLIEYWGDEDGTHLYFVHWTNGGLAGYTTAHKLKDIEQMLENVKQNT